MKDSDIFGMNQKRAQMDARLYRQFMFLLSRIDAYEAVLSSPLAILKAILAPKWLKAEVNRLQMELIKKHDVEMKEAAQEIKAKPKLTIVGANGITAAGIILMVLMTGCVTPNRHKAAVAGAYKTGYETADKECIDLQKRLAAFIDKQNQRLRSFNQVDKKGNLIPLKKPKWTGTDSWEDDVNEDAPWMK